MSVLIIVKRFVSIRIECMNYSGELIFIKTPGVNDKVKSKTTNKMREWFGSWDKSWN